MLPVGIKWICDKLCIERYVWQCIIIFHATHKFRPENMNETLK